MSTDIQVTQQSANTAAADLSAVADALKLADGLVQHYIHADTSGGFFLTNAGGHLNEVRSELGHQYATLSTTLEDASAAIVGIWKAFEHEDDLARQRFDKAKADAAQAGTNQNGTGLFGGPTGGILDNGTIVMPPPAITTHPQPGPASRSVDETQLDGLLGAPEADTSWMDVINGWGDIKEKIDEITSFTWVTGPLDKVGVHVPLDHFKKWMEGNYFEWSQGIAAVFALGTFFKQVDTDMGQSSRQIEGRWLGLSAMAVQGWLTDFGGAAGYHRGQLNLWANQIQTEAIECKLLLDQLLDLLSDLADLIPIIEINGHSLIDKGISLLKGAAKSLAHAITGVIHFAAKFVLKFELLVDVLWTILDLVSQGGGKLTFQPIHRPVVPTS